MSTHTYTIENITRELPGTLQQYLEAQYHIWDEDLVKERQRLLSERGTIFQEPYIEATPSYVAGQSYTALKLPPCVSKLLTDASNKVGDVSTGIPSIPYAHQRKRSMPSSTKNMNSSFRQAPAPVRPKAS